MAINNKFNKLAIGLVTLLIGIVIIMNFSAEAVPEIGEAGDQMNDTNICTAAGGVYNTSNDPICHEAANNSAAVAYISIPLGGLFGSGGVAVLAIMAAILIAVVTVTIIKKRH